MFTPLFIGGIGPVEMAFVLMLAVLLFGAQKLPKLTRSAGQATGEFRRGRMEIEEELDAAVASDPDDETATGDGRDVETV